jgi:hypothetical protein
VKNIERRIGDKEDAVAMIAGGLGQVLGRRVPTRYVSPVLAALGVKLSSFYDDEIEEPQPLRRACQFVAEHCSFPVTGSTKTVTIILPTAKVILTATQQGLTLDVTAEQDDDAFLRYCSE